MNFSVEESKENDLIIKAATGNSKTRTIRNLLFSLTLQAVRINNQEAPILGLAKSLYYIYVYIIPRPGPYGENLLECGPGQQPKPF